MIEFDNPDVIYFDDQRDLLSSLRLLTQEISAAEEDSLRWKWVVIALHNALQTSMVMALRGSSHTGIHDRKDLLRWERIIKTPNRYYTNQDSKALQERKEDLKFIFKIKLSSFMRLYSRIERRFSIRNFEDEKIFVPSKVQRDAMEALNEYRNSFIHFKPNSWYLSKSRIIEFLELCVPLLSYIILKSGSVRIKIKDGRDAELVEIKKIIEHLSRAYSLSQSI